jgi:hypothetical protein
MDISNYEPPSIIQIWLSKGCEKQKSWNIQQRNLAILQGNSIQFG